MIFFKIVRLNLLVLLLFFSISRASAQVKSFQKTNFGVSFILNRGNMNVYLLKNDLAEIKFTVLDKMPDKKSLVVESVKSYLKNFSVDQNKEQVVITTARMKIKVNRKTAAITFTDLSGNIILAEADENSKLMRDTSIVGIKTYSCATSFESPKDEALYGLGCHPLDSLSIN